MQRPQLEKDAEREILNSLHKAGLVAFHMDTTIDGFPDILVMGGYVALIEMKYDRSGGRIKLSELMESSQPVFMHDCIMAGFYAIHLCVFDGESYTIYDTANILNASMAGHTLGSLTRIISHASPAAVADYIMEDCCAC